MTLKPFETNESISHPDLAVVQTKPNKRNATLDVLRGAAIMMVVLCHVILTDKKVVGHSVFKYVRLVFSFIERGGWSGVDLFFVLSGFLVSGLLFNEYNKTKTVQPGRFLIRRGLKIYPGFIFFILTTLLIETNQSNIFGVNFPVSDYIKDLFFLHNYLGGRWGPTWSLDVEEAFYFLLTGFFILAVRYDKLSLRLLIGIYIALAVVGIIERGINNIMHPSFDYPLHFTQTHLRLDALFFGVLLAYLYHFKREQLFGFLKKYKKIIIPLIALMIIPNFLFIRDNNWWISVILLATNPVAYGCILLLALNSNLSLLNNKILSFIGRHSYAIYLWHPFINVYTNHYLNTSRAGFLVYVFIYLIVSITTGYIMTKLIEEPFLRIREKIYPSKSKAPIIVIH